MKAELIDHMGSDLTVVNAARVSFGKHKDTFDDKDSSLIRYLARHGHWTPFGHPQITVREQVPIFVARQRFKHTVGFVYNEVSRRYVDSEPEFYTPDKWRGRAENKKQGSSDEEITHLELGEHVVWDDPRSPNLEMEIAPYYDMMMTELVNMYNLMVENGVAPEQARMVLPQSMYTEYYVTGSLAAWARAYNLRSDPHAQQEIQDLAKQWQTIIAPLFPVSWDALTKDIHD